MGGEKFLRADWAFRESFQNRLGVGWACGEKQEPKQQSCTQKALRGVDTIPRPTVCVCGCVCVCVCVCVCKTTRAWWNETELTSKQSNERAITSVAAPAPRDILSALLHIVLLTMMPSFGASSIRRSFRRGSASSGPGQRSDSFSSPTGGNDFKGTEQDNTQYGIHIDGLLSSLAMETTSSGSGSPKSTNNNDNHNDNDNMDGSSKRQSRRRSSRRPSASSTTSNDSSSRRRRRRSSSRQKRQKEPENPNTGVGSFSPSDPADATIAPSWGDSADVHQNPDGATSARTRRRSSSHSKGRASASRERRRSAALSESQRNNKDADTNGNAVSYGVGTALSTNETDGLLVGGTDPSNSRRRRSRLASFTRRSSRQSTNYKDDPTGALEDRRSSHSRSALATTSESNDPRRPSVTRRESHNHQQDEMLVLQLEDDTEQLRAIRSSLRNSHPPLLDPNDTPWLSSENGKEQQDRGSATTDSSTTAPLHAATEQFVNEGSSGRSGQRGDLESQQLHYPNTTLRKKQVRQARCTLLSSAVLTAICIVVLVIVVLVVLTIGKSHRGVSIGNDGNDTTVTFRMCSKATDVYVQQWMEGPCKQNSTRNFRSAILPSCLTDNIERPHAIADSFLFELYGNIPSIDVIQTPVNVCAPQYLALVKYRAALIDNDQLDYVYYLLAVLYYSTHDPVKSTEWTQDHHWLSAVVPLCDWYGIRCSNMTNTDTVDNPDASSSPSSPSSIILQSLDLGQNRLAGTIPTELGFLTQLTSLLLFDNALGGTLPTELGLLTNLEILDVPSNGIQGSLPSELGSLTKLQEFFVFDNSLTGTVPFQIFGRSLRSLRWEWNDLTGSIPTEIGRASNLHDLGLAQNNRLTGTLPSEIGKLSHLRELSITCPLCDPHPFPVALVNFTKLEIVTLRNMRLTGTLPTEIGSRSGLGEYPCLRLTNGMAIVVVLAVWTFFARLNAHEIIFFG